MPFTSLLGAAGSQLGNIILGDPHLSQLLQRIEQSLAFAHRADANFHSAHPAESLILQQTLAHSVSRGGSGFEMAFTSLLGTANSRLANIVLGALGGTSLIQSVSQSMELAQLARANFAYASVSDTLSLAQLASGVSTAFPRSASNTLALGQTAIFSVDRLLSVSQSLSLSQGLNPGGVFGEDVSDTLTLTDEATRLREVQRTVVDTLTLVQDTVENIRNVTVSQSLTLSQIATTLGPLYLTVSHFIQLAQVGDDHIGVNNQAISDGLLFVSKAGLTFEVSVSQSLSFSQIGERSNKIEDTLNLVQTVLVGKGGDVEHSLTLTQTAHITAILSRTINQSLGVHQSVAFYVEGDCTKKEYAPFVGSSTDATYTPPSTTEPTLTRTDLTLTYPFVAPTTTLVLRNPEFNDKDRLSFTRINRTTRGGTLIVFSDPKWPKTQTLALQIDNLSQKQAADVLAFLRQSLGQEIGLLDWDNRQWRGLVTTPDAQITHVRKNDRSIAFEFEGTLA